MDAERKRKLKRLVEALLSIFAIVGVYLVLFALDITCPIKWLSGISCPGCGMSRACFALLKLDFAAAFSYHPVIFALPVFAGLYGFFAWKNMERSRNAGIYAFAAVMIATYFIRLFTGTPVVVFEPSEGVVLRTIKRLFFN